MARDKSWDDIWAGHRELNWLGRRLKFAQRKALDHALEKIKLEKSARILDVGCGTGASLDFFRSMGYKNSLGVDSSQESLKLCGRRFGFTKSRDVFLMDARRLRFPRKSFDLVFSDGTIEHLPEIEKAASEFARLSRGYIFLFQPNQKSLFGLVKDLAFKMKKVSWEKEYRYSKDDYVNAFLKHGFHLADSGSVNMDEMMWLLFKRSGKG